MSIFDALLETPIRLIHAPHEAAAVHMADAWARLTGECGFALVTGCDDYWSRWLAEPSDPPCRAWPGRARRVQHGSGEEGDPATLVH